VVVAHGAMGIGTNSLQHLEAMRATLNTVTGQAHLRLKQIHPFNTCLVL
jgi:hypothetical protein